MATSFGFGQREAFSRYVEERMEQHRRWRHDAERELIEGIIDDLQALPSKRRPCSGRLFEAVPEETR